MRDWMIQPCACKTCGRRLLVTCVWPERSDDLHWSSTCAVCLPITASWFVTVGALRIPVDLVAREVLSLPTSRGLELELWNRPGLFVNACAYSDVVRTFSSLGHKRVNAIRAAAEPVWKLERRSDGTVWAPWDPVRGYHRNAQAAPLCPTMIHKRRTAAKCVGCEEVIAEGCSAWRPNPGLGPRHFSWWSSAGRAKRWCPRCVAAVVAADDPVVHEGSLVGHLRVFEGGRAVIADGVGDA